MSSIALFSFGTGRQIIKPPFMNIQTQIRSAIEDAGLTPAEVARRLGFTPQAVNGWLTTGRISKNTLSALAALTGKSIEYFLLTGDPPRQVTEPASSYSPLNDKYAFVRRFNVQGGTGPAHENGHEEISGTHAYRRDWLERKKLLPGACVVIEAEGDSMHPTIFDGDVVLINTSAKRLTSGQVFAFSTEDGVRIKRLFKQLDGRVRVVSDNQDKINYPDEYLTPGMETEIIGMVVHRSGGV